MAIDDDVPVFQNDQEESRYWRSLARDLDSELESTREALEEYQASSKELEQELERDIEAREKREAQLNTMLEVAQAEVQDWRTKFQTSLKEHSKTLTHVTKELDAVRKSEEAYRTKLRDMELDNDDLEKSERAMGSTLSDLETRYGKAIERTALLEEELVEKARLEEEVQRLKDELRDLNEEMAVLQEQGTRPPSRATTSESNTEAPTQPRSETPASRPTQMSPEPMATPPVESNVATAAESTLLTDEPIPSSSSNRQTNSVADKTPRKSADLSKTIKRTSGIPRSTSAQSMNNPSPSKPRLSASSTSPDVRFPASVSPTMSRIPASTTITDLSSVASGKTQAASQIRAKITPDAATERRSRVVSRAPSAAQASPSTPGQGSTPRALRDARANCMMHDLQSMTARVKAMTARVDGRRTAASSSSSASANRPAWSTSIPKPASATPARMPLSAAQTSAAQARIAARRAAARGGGAAGSSAAHTTPRASMSRRSFASPGSLEDELSRAQADSPTSRAASYRRPSSRASMSASRSRPTTPSLYGAVSSSSSYSHSHNNDSSNGHQRPTTPSQRPRTPSRMYTKHTSRSSLHYRHAPPPSPAPSQKFHSSEADEEERW